MNTLFETQNITLHSGEESYFKIECDSLSEEDIETLALIISKKLEFSRVYGIPTGGERLAKALEQYITPQQEIENREGMFFGRPPSYSVRLLIVDDVLTTGRSFEEAKRNLETKWTHTIQGVCIFCRDKKSCPDWVDPVFTLWQEEENNE